MLPLFYSHVQVFYYLPLPNMLRKLYTRIDISAHLHLIRHTSPAESDPIHDIQFSPRFIEKVFDSGFATQEKRNIVLGLCTDGFDPFKNSVYSAWPLMMQVCYS